jgi:hypothetical protein
MSTNGGSVWTEIDSNYFSDGMDMVLDDTAPGTVWTSGYRNNHMAVSKSTNWGGSWSRDELSSATGRAHTLAISPSSNNTVYAGGYENSAPAIYRTTNGGTSWSKLSASGLAGYVHDILIDPVDTTIIYAATESGIYRSTNSGSSFTKISGSVSFTKCLYMDPADNGTIYAATYGQGVWYTTDAGSSWQEMNAGLDEMDTNAISMNPGAWLFCGSDGRSVLRYDISTSTGEFSSPLDSRILTAAPNPAHGFVTISFESPGACEARLSVYDLTGRLVADLFEGAVTTGMQTMVWNADTAPGIYFLVLTAGDEVHTQRLAVVR